MFMQEFTLEQRFDPGKVMGEDGSSMKQVGSAYGPVKITSLEVDDAIKARQNQRRKMKGAVYIIAERWAKSTCAALMICNKIHSDLGDQSATYNSEDTHAQLTSCRRHKNSGHVS